jgi:nucleoid-associated protein YgaU
MLFLPASTGAAGAAAGASRERDPATASSPEPARPSRESGRVRIHEVKKGETLSAISRLYYGTPNRWKAILEANSEKVSDPRAIRPGLKLTIPDLNH